MKNTLLASTALVALAGAAAAEVSWGGSFDLGYNSLDGFYWEGGLTVSGAMDLDNGLSVGFSMDASFLWSSSYNIFDSTYISWNSYEVFLKSDTAGLYFGNTDTAADMHWDGVSGMEQGFNDVDDADDNGAEAILRGEVTFGSVSAALSYELTGGTTVTPMEALQLGATAEVGAATIIFAYQDADNYDGEAMGIAAKMSFGGADLHVAYAEGDVDTSVGFGVSYPVGPVTIGAAYAMNDIADDAWELTADYASGPITVGVGFDSTDDWWLDGSYDMGNGLVFNAGIATAGDDYYAGAEMDLGGGASAFISYNTSDEVGGPEYNEGTEVGVSFTF